MKRYSSLLAIVLLSSLTAATVTGQETESYVHPSGFGLSYSKPWVALTHEQVQSAKNQLPAEAQQWLQQSKIDFSKVSLVLLRVNQSGFMENMNVIVQEGEAPIDEGAAQKIGSAISGKLKTVGMTVDSVVAKIQKFGTHEAIVITFRSTIPGLPFKLRQRQVMMSGGGKNYVITCTATEQTYDAASGEFDRILETTKLQPRKSGAIALTSNPIMKSAIIGGIFGALIGGGIALVYWLTRR